MTLPGLMFTIKMRCKCEQSSSSPGSHPLRRGKGNGFTEIDHVARIPTYRQELDEVTSGDS